MERIKGGCKEGERKWEGGDMHACRRGKLKREGIEQVVVVWGEGEWREMGVGKRQDIPESC